MQDKNSTHTTYGEYKLSFLSKGNNPLLSEPEWKRANPIVPKSLNDSSQKRVRAKKIKTLRRSAVPAPTNSRPLSINERLSNYWATNSYK